MPDKSEDVKYSFTGDVTSLKSATESASKLLNTYQKIVERAVKKGNFSASARSTQTFNNTITRVSKDVDKLSAKLKKVGDIKLPTGSASYKAMGEVLSTVSKQVNALSSATRVGTKDLTQYRAELNAARSAMSSASSQIDRLVSGELKFQKALETVRVKVSQTKNVVQSLQGTVTSTINPMVERVRNLGSVFDSVRNTIQSFRDRASAALERVSALSSTVASAFRRNASSSDDLDKAAAKTVRALGNESKGLQTSAKEAGNATTQHRKLSKSFSDLAPRINSCSSSMKSLVGVSELASKAFTTLVGVKVGTWLAGAAKEAISYIENLNLFTVAMGDAIDEGNRFVAAMQEVYGMDPSNIMRYAGNFYQLASAIEMPEAAATNLSLVLTKAANDISSLFNVDIETVFENLSSGIQGMSRAVKKYGMDIRTSTLQQTALNLGLTQQVENMSEANRQGLRFLTMMQQASNASGDFARTIESPANQLKILKEQITQLGRAIGNFFIGPVGQAVAYLNGFIMALRSILTFIAELLGLITGVSTSFKSGADAADKQAGAISGIGSAAKKAAKQMQSLIAPFDELNILQENTDTGGGSAGGIGGGGLGSDILDPAIAKAIADLDYQLENVKMKANQVRDAILEFLGFEVDMGKIISWDPDKFEKNLIDAFPNWTKTIQATFDNWTDIMEGFSNVLKALGNVFALVGAKVKAFISLFINDDTVSTFINGLADSLNNLADWINSNQNTLANFIVILGALWTGFAAFQKIAAFIAPIASFISTVSGALAPFSSLLGTVGLVVAAIALLYDNSVSFATAFDNLLTAVGSGLGTVLGSIVELFGTIWESMQVLWAENIQPMIAQTGEALAPVIDTLTVVWNAVITIIDDVINAFNRLWQDSIHPAVAAIADSITSLMEIFESLWADAIGPVLENIIAGLADLWTSSVSPIVEQIIGIISRLIEIVLALWNNILAPLIDWLVKSLGPTVANLVNTIWNIVSSLFQSLSGVIQGLLTALQGLLDFIAGVFTGDWERAWKGIVNVFVGIGNSIISVFELVVNGIIGLINAMISLVYNAVVTLINSVLGAVEGIAGLVGIDLDLTIKAAPPAIPKQSWPRIPALASGGVITSPTYAMIGEGQYNEAVIPLDDSPQVEELLRKFADIVDDNNNGGGGDVEVHVYIGGKEVDAEIYKASKRGEKVVGKQPIKTE